MSSYDKYKNTRDSAWNFLIENQIFNFPVDVKSLAKKYMITIIHQNIISDQYASTVKINNRFVIIHSNTGTTEQQRFSLLHELGHIILGHFNNEGPLELMETQSNIFASRVLMPMIIIHHEHLYKAEQISKFFGVSIEAARIRLKRYNYIKGKQKFLSSPLEKKYYDLYQLEHNRN